MSRGLPPGLHASHYSINCDAGLCTNSFVRFICAFHTLIFLLKCLMYFIITLWWEFQVGICLSTIVCFNFPRLELNLCLQTKSVQLGMSSHNALAAPTSLVLSTWDMWLCSYDVSFYQQIWLRCSPQKGSLYAQGSDSASFTVANKCNLLLQYH